MPITKILKKNILKNFNKDELENYIETGIHEGYSIYQALEIGFKNIIGIEKNIDYVSNTKKKFQDNKFLNIIHADSRNGLEEAFKNLNNNSFVFLDAHGHLEINDSPLEDELIFLKKKKNSIKLVIIDDFYQIKKGNGHWQKNTNLKNILNLSKSFFENGKSSVNEIFYYYGGFFNRKKNSYLVISRNNKFDNHNFFYRLFNEIYIYIIHKIKR